MPAKGEILKNGPLKGDYYRVCFYEPDICDGAMPGQFVHVRLTELRDRILRRPFSICDVASDGTLTVVYKVVGEGTEALSKLSPGSCCDLMGPLGKPFSLPEDDEIPVLVAGGYGVAAMFTLAKKSQGHLLLGARSEKDIILTDLYGNESYDVKLATEDGSLGHKGLVTEILAGLIEENPGAKFRFYGCGPKGMLMAMGRMLLEKGLDGELSLDHLMCCGVGACFACVVKVKADNEDGWRYARTCKEGPVFKASEVYYD